MLHPEAPAMVRAFLALHIVAGTVALVVVPMVMAVGKGSLLHRRLGLVFVYGMFVVAATALIIAPYFRSYFLLLVAVFSAYLTFLGWRALARKHPLREPAGAADWAGALLAIAAGGGMVAIGIAQHTSFSMVLYALGTICLGSGARSIYQFFRPPTATAAWLFAHFGSMLAAYIATVTAFSAVNFAFINPIWVRWLWPTVLGTLVITYYTARYKTKLAHGAHLRELVTVRGNTPVSAKSEKQVAPPTLTTR